MKRKQAIVASMAAAGWAVGIFAAGSSSAQCGTTGPDVVCGDLGSVTRWGSVGGITAYSMATTMCNEGTARIEVIANTNHHPVMTMNLYRMKDGRFEQVGMSWVRHTYFALSTSLCCTCSDPTDGSRLGVGCSSPDTATSNGQQPDLSRRSDVKADTGVFVFPISGGSGFSAIDRRLQVHDVDLAPGANAGALYFLESQLIAPDDASHANGLNNASFRRVVVSEGTPGVFTMLTSGSAETRKAAIEAWAENDAGVSLASADVAGDGRFTLGCKVTALGGGMWRYEYALHNLNSDRAGGSFSVALPLGVHATNIGFHDVDYHSGEIYDGADWSASVSGGAITWSSVPFAVNQNANALRWGTLYNFRFDADEPPAPSAGSATIGLFKPGIPASPESIAIAASAPGAPACAADLNGDGLVGSPDLAILLGAWGGALGDLNGDGQTGAADLAALLGAWGVCG